jgi:VanZ family protein
MKYLRKYFANLYIAIGWSILIFILLSLPGSMIPNESTFVIPNFDKVVHIGLFGGFVLLWSLYFSAKGLPSKKLLRLFFFIFIIAVIYGIGMEYVQKYFIPLRYYDDADIIADMIGAGLAYGLSNLTLAEVG